MCVIATIVTIVITTIVTIAITIANTVFAHIVIANAVIAKYS
jgi:hypothetical protein